MSRASLPVLSKVKLVSFCLSLCLSIASVGGYSAYLMAGQPKQPIQLPKDRQQVVLSWDLWRSDLPRTKDGPTLQIWAGGNVTVTDPHGAGTRVEAQMTAEELQQLLRFALRDKGFFRIDQVELQERIRAARLKDGLPPETTGVFSTILRMAAEGKDQEIRCPDLAGNAERCPEAQQLLAIERRLEGLKSWAYAGGDSGVKAALQAANKEIRREFPEAPLLRAEDLQSAIQRLNGTSQIIFERRAVSSDMNPYSFVHARLDRSDPKAETRVIVRAALGAVNAEPTKLRPPQKGPFKLEPTPIAQDQTIKWDYPIVYVRVPRDPSQLPQFANTHPPTVMPPGSELVVLHPDGCEEVLVPVKEKEAITDPFVSFDGNWVYFVKFHDVSKRTNEIPAGSDIYKVHVATRKVVQLTQQGFTPNTAAAALAKQPFLHGKGVYNLGPCPAPGGKVVFTSDRNAFRSAKNQGHPLAQQLFVMDDDGANVETIGHLNLGGVLHPVILKDGRIIFTTSENQGLRGGYFFWGIWSIHPDGTNWGPVVSAYDGDVFHFYTQMSDGQIVMSTYYPGGITRGFGTFLKMPAQAPDGRPSFGPANNQDARNRIGATILPMSFTPHGLESLTLFASRDDVRPNSAFGQVTQPAGAPDNHLLTVWGTSGLPKDALKPPGFLSRPAEAFDSGIYLIKSGKAIAEPGEMVLIKNDPKYHELWPRALVPYKRIYGVNEPRRPTPVRNDGKLCKHLPEGVPYGLVGSSSLYKRESYPQGTVPDGQVTAVSPKGRPDSFGHLGRVYGGSSNWQVQGADAGLYDNADIHAIRILITEPVTAGQSHPFRGHATSNVAQMVFAAPSERLRILGEFPVRKFLDGKQPIDPDGHPDTSFEAKVPGDIAWTFQTLDKRGMVLNMAQTWHQIRPGERRNDCGGCHAHSQKPTDFYQTAAGKPDYVPWDLTGPKIPLVTSKANDQTGKQWDVNKETGVRFVDSVTNVEFVRDVKPILNRSCVACHTQKWDKPAGNLVLDDDRLIQGLPGTYFRLAMDMKGQHGHKSLAGEWGGGGVQATRYIRKMQARRSLLIWKVFGERLDGWTNDDHPTENVPGDPQTLQHKGQPIPNTRQNIERADLDFTGSAMPPPEAVAGTYVGPDGKKIKVAPLSDEDRRTLVRWVDLGCPLDLDPRGQGWHFDDNRPTLALTYPRPGANEPLTRLLLGMHDYGTGLDMGTFQVTADFALGGAAAGDNLAAKFTDRGDGVWELKLATPLVDLPRGKLTAEVRDRQGNLTRIERIFSVAKVSR